MQNAAKRKFLAYIVFCVGLVLSLLSSALLLFSFASITQLQTIGSFLFLIIGGLFIFLAKKIKRRPLYLFFATFFILLGLFLLLHVTGIVILTLKQSWPLLSVFAGLALLPAGSYRYGTIRRIYLIPSVALIILGGFLLLFSLKVTHFSFKQFILNWYPVIILMAGIMLILLSLSSNNRERM
jgi:hypothetical protein